MTATLGPVIIAALLSGSVVVTPTAGAATSAATADRWSGTVQVTTEFPEQTQSFGPGYSFTYSRTDSATYTLAGTQPVGIVYSATMRGQGAGRAVSTFSPPNATCVAVTDPQWGWSHSGSSTVEIGYANGAFSIRPRGVPGTARNVDLNPECAGGSNEPFPMVVPPGIEETAPTARQTAPATTSRLSGSQSFRWQRPQNPGDTIFGTMTVTWNLVRVAAPPSGGVLEGAVLVNGRPYTSGQPIPYGSTVDVTNGRLALTTEVGTLTVYGAGVSAVFKLLRAKEKGKPLDELRLVKGDFSVCNRRLASAGQKKKPSTTVRRLWAKGKGNFRTRGRYSSSTVRGTFWLTADRCDGTLTSVRQGRLEVSDFVKKTKVLVGAGKSYLAATRG